MKKEGKQLNRRFFIKSSAMASTIMLGATSLSSCANDQGEQQEATIYSSEKGKGNKKLNGVSGMLFSQIGYEKNIPARIIIRLENRDEFPDGSICTLENKEGTKSFSSPFRYWGEIWKSHWWVSEFNLKEEEGVWNVEARHDDEVFFRDENLIFKKDILWDETFELSSVDMLERRTHFTKVGAGWQDAGTLWVESPAQSAMIIALTEMVEKKADKCDAEFLSRIYKQITVGCDYLLMIQNKSEELGYPSGSFTHDLHGHENDILPHDAAKAIVALARASRILPEEFNKQKKDYYQAAINGFQYLTESAKPMGAYGFSFFQRGLDTNTVIPDSEWQTRNLVEFCWAALEIYNCGDIDLKNHCIDYAQQIMQRQIPKENPENGFYGHFLEYDSTTHSEKAWCHGIVNDEFGSDLGGIYPNYLMPLIEMLKIWPDHEDASRWKETLHHFTYGYLIPACEMNPFKIIPLGIFNDEGPVWFCGTFHGTNAIYGYTGALALELSILFDDPTLKEIAYGNLQWIAGLNGGITQDNLAQGCVIFSTDVPDQIALPASMICGIGKRWAGTWFQTRGVICNGFSTGKQFVYDVPPKRKNDGPFSLTDEDWIPHSAAWITGLIRL